MQDQLGGVCAIAAALFSIDIPAICRGISAA